MGFLYRAIQPKDGSAIRNRKQIVALKARRDWRARTTQLTLVRNTKYALILGMLVAPSFATQFFGSAILGLSLLLGSAVGFAATALIGVHAQKKRRAIEDSYSESQGENIRFAITEEQLQRFFPEELERRSDYSHR